MTKKEIIADIKKADKWRDGALELIAKGKYALALHEYAASFGLLKDVITRLLKENNNG